MDLPDAPSPAGLYVSTSIFGRVIHGAGATPRKNGKVEFVGTVGADLDKESAVWAAALAAENALSGLVSAAGGVDRIERILRTRVFVRCAPDFVELACVADGASRALQVHLGAASLSPRTTVGVVSLPSGAPVEVELTALLLEPSITSAGDPGTSPAK